MERAAKIIRRSIFILLKDFHYYITNPVILLLPFSASVLLFQSCSQTKSIFPLTRISLLDLNFSQVIFSYVISLPFALSSLVVAKASIIKNLHSHDQHKPAISSLYKPLVSTYLCNTSLFLLLLVASNFVEKISGLSSKSPLFVLAAGIVLYMVLTNAMIIGNLALVVAGMDDCSGYRAIHRAWLVKQGANSMALLLALPINLGFVAIESLFQYRVIRAYHLSRRANASMIVEGWLISIMFSLLIVLDTIACCLIVKSYESDRVQIEIVKEDRRISGSLQSLDELL